MTEWVNVYGPQGPWPEPGGIYTVVYRHPGGANCGWFDTSVIVKPVHPYISDDGLIHLRSMAVIDGGYKELTEDRIKAWAPIEIPEPPIG